MCGRTSLFVPPWLLAERFDATAGEDLPRGYNRAPGDDLAAIRNDAPDTIDALEWGLVPGWADRPEDGPRPINARAETVAEKPAFADAFERRRCLVLADGFYEWDGDRPYRFVRPDNQPFAMAGLWERREPDGADGAAPGTVAVITTAANGVMADVHDRMPVVLPPDEERAWLADRPAGELRDLLGPPAADALRRYPVPRRVNDPANDDPGVVRRATTSVQTGLGEF